MNKILVIRVGRAGDIIMITPALLAILDNYPEHEIHLLTSADGKRVLNGFNKRIIKTYIYKSSGLNKYFERLRINKQIRNTGYELIFNLEMKSYYKNIYRDLGVLAYELDDSEPHLNYAKRCLNVIQRSVDVEIKNYWDWLPVTSDGMFAAKQQLASAGIADDDFLVGFHPTFSGSKKKLFYSKDDNLLRQWPPEYFAKLGQLIHEYGCKNRIDIKIVIDLLPEERELGESIVKMSQGVIRLLTNEPDFERYKATIKRMNLLITPNTGPMHIAAAVKTNIVALFVEWDPSDCGPYMEENNYKILRAEELGQGGNSLDEIKPEHVFRECIQYLPNPIIP